MARRSRHDLGLLLLASTAFAIACVARDVDRMNLDGLTVVRNAQTGATAAELVEDLRLGKADGAEHEAFGVIAHVLPHSDGSFWMLDRQALRVHVYARDGAHLRSFGGPGDAPGEFRSFSGVVELSDGSVAIHDGRLRRVTILSTQGEVLSTRTTPGNVVVATVNLLYPSADGYLLKVSLGNASEDSHSGLARFSSGSSVPDTLVPPASSLDRRYRLTASSGDGRTTTGTVPFAPEVVWAWHRGGFWVMGDGRSYHVFLITPAGDTIRVIERVVPAVAVRPEEAEEQRGRMVAGMSRTQPGWSWPDVDIPDQKPLFSDLTVSADGRIWVRRRMPGKQSDVRAGARDAPGVVAPTVWYEPTVFDVFEVDGRFIGEVQLPDDTPAILLGAYGDHIWLPGSNSIGVPQVVRYRVGFPGLTR